MMNQLETQKKLALLWFKKEKPMKIWTKRMLILKTYKSLMLSIKVMNFKSQRMVRKSSH